MRITLRRFLVLLSIFNCANDGLARVLDYEIRNTNLLERFIEDVSREGSTVKTRSVNVGVSRRSLIDSSSAFLALGTITSANVRSERKRRDSAIGDGAAHDFVVSDDRSVREDGESTREKTFVASSFETMRHSKHRRRHRCKNRSTCARSSYRNIGNEDDDETKINKSAEDREVFQVQQSRNDRNLERQLLVGNRSLALFRQEFTAIADPRKIDDRSFDEGSREIDDILADTRTRRTQTITKILSTKVSSEEKIEVEISHHLGRNDTTGNENIEEDRLAEDERNDSALDFKPEVTGTKNKSQGFNDSYVIEDYNFSKNGRFNVTYRNDLCKNSSENETNLDCWKEKSESRISLENSDEELLDSTIFATIYMPIDDRHGVIHESLVALLSRLFNTLKNSTTMAESREILRNLDERRNSLNNNAAREDDLCQKWLDSKDKLEEVFLGPLVYLPACPCQYPSSIFYDDKIWDVGQNKYFRWRDVSGESERLDVYKPGATYCVRSLLTQGSGHAAAQHCCYDRQRRLLTRGSGAGTPNFVSPEISTKLHERIDILPWRLCKGDFTRFNKVRTPNNDNRCKTNPDDDEYRRQIENTKYY